MIMDAKKLSQMIRAKKKKLMESDPDLVDYAVNPKMNPNQIMDNEMDARIESTLNSPERSNEDERSMAMSDADDLEMGLTDSQKSRMERLRKYIDELDM